MSTGGPLTANDPGGIEPLWKPLEVAVAQDGGRVDDDLPDPGEGVEGVLLHGGDHVVPQVHFLQVVQAAGEGRLAH